MPSAQGVGLTLSLLGVPVRVSCDVPDLAERLAICYERSFAAADDHALEASLCTAPGGSGFAIQVDGREPRTELDPVLAVRALNHELMHGVMLRRRDLYYVHAAVVRYGPFGILLPGLSQAGKSTLALAFLVAGARYLSDELLAYDASTGTAHPFPRAPKIRDACVDYFPGHAEDFVGAGEGRFLPFSTLPEDVVAQPTPIGCISLPRWSGTDGETRLTPVSPGTCLLELAASSLNFGTHRVQSLDFLTELVGGARSFRLEWREPHAAVELLQAALRGDA